MPQVADILLIIGLITYVFCNKGVIRIPGEYGRHLRNCVLIIAYQVFINTIWAVVLSSTLFISRSTYYIFNLLAYAYIFMLCFDYDYQEVIEVTVKGCVFSAIIAAAGVFFLQGQAVRRTGFFNNPNQLGYYALVIIAFGYYFFKNKKQKWLVYGVSTLMIILSASKAAFVGLFIFFLFAIFSTADRSWTNIVWKIIVLFAFAAGLYIILFSNDDRIASNTVILTLRHRFLRLESDDILWTGRGYERVTEVGVHFLWGMGEGAFDRFSSLTDTETHSTYVTIFVSYGLIGVSGYFYIIKQTIGKTFRTALKNITALSGILVYIASHNGIRNTLVWILLAMMLISNHEELLQKQKEIT